MKRLRSEISAECICERALIEFTPFLTLMGIKNQTVMGPKDENDLIAEQHLRASRCQLIITGEP